MSLYAEPPHPGTAVGFAIVFIFLYFIPTLAAIRKQCLGSVFVLNLFLGWTLVGWVVALAWALKDPVPPKREKAMVPTSNSDRY